MANKKIEECQSCGYKTAEYDEEKGYYKCPTCHAIWWDDEDRQPGETGGFICNHCGNRETRPLQIIYRIQIDNNLVKVRRCKICGRVLLEPSR